jgi:hypothetical protein
MFADQVGAKTAIATAITREAPKIRTGTWTFGRKSKDEKWNELCVDLMRCELSKPGVDLTDLIILGPKPQMPLKMPLQYCEACPHGENQQTSDTIAQPLSCPQLSIIFSSTKYLMRVAKSKVPFDIVHVSHCQ